MISFLDLQWSWFHQGVRINMDSKDCYSTLGVQRGASDDEIKKSYKKIATPRALSSLLSTYY